MSIKAIVLAVLGSAVLAAIMMLFVEVRAAPAKPDLKAIGEAMLRYKRTHAAPSPTNLDDPWARSPTPVTPVPDARPPRAELDPKATPPVPAAPAEPPPRLPTAGEAATPNIEGDPHLDGMTAKDEANRMYDKQDYDGALERAITVLQAEPGDIRMLRVAVSSACQLGEADKAKQYWAQLPPHDQAQMNRRCQRFGITFGEQ